MMLLQAFGESVADDVRGLVHPEAAPGPLALRELEPPPSKHFHFHAPLGFVSLVAAGALLAAAGGVQERVHDRHSHRARRPNRARGKHLNPRPGPLLPE